MLFRKKKIRENVAKICDRRQEVFGIWTLTLKFASAHTAVGEFCLKPKSKSGGIWKLEMTEQMKFSVVCSLFTWMQRSKSLAKKRSKFRKFLDSFCNPRDYFTAIRLVLPNLDRERGTYGLKESVLATCLIDALGMSRDSQDALRLLNWRKGGAQTGANAGNFSLVAAEVCCLVLNFMVCSIIIIFFTDWGSLVRANRFCSVDKAWRLVD